MTGEDRDEVLLACETWRRGRLLRSLRLAGALVALVFLADGVVELLTQPGVYAATVMTRTGVGLYALACALGAHRLSPRVAPVPVILLGIGVAVDVATAAVAGGGMASPWATGEMLILVAAGLLAPLDPGEITVLALAVWGIDGFLIVPAAANASGDLAAHLLFLGAATVIALAATFSLSGMRRRDFLAQEEIKRERARSDRLLLSILPPAIAERLKQGEEPIADARTQVTVLFADICGFTAYAAGRPPHEVVATLDEVFSVFDDLSGRHGLEKIKTIGDAYMAVAGLPEPIPDHAAAAAAMAVDMRAAAHDLASERIPGLRIRIGLHSGPVVAGVIGTTRFSYDLWGDTVNVASRMESQGEPDGIQITEEVRRRLPSTFRVEPRGTVEIRGKGLMKTYWLVEPRGAADRPEEAPLR